MLVLLLLSPRLSNLVVLLVFSFSVRYHQEELLKRLAKLSRGWHAVSALVFEHD